MLLFHAQGKTNSDGSIVNFTVESKQGIVSVKAIVPIKNSPPALRTYQCRSRVITVDTVFHELRSEFQVHDIAMKIKGSDLSDVAGFIGGSNPVRGSARTSL